MSVPGYELFTFLGSGADGLIFSAISKEGKSFAVKIFDLNTKQQLQRFKNESIFANKFTTCVGTISVKEIFQHDNLGYIVMDLAAQDLLEIIESESAIPEEDAIFIFHDVCKAVKTLHEQGVAHLDIKPENILITNEGEVEICDFASASYLEKISSDKCFVCTPSYTAPERFSTGKFDGAAADVWSLGILLHVLITGYFPFSNSSSVQYPRNLDFNFVSSVATSACIDLIKSMLALDPAERPSLDQILGHSVFA